jgi:transcriptional regulator with XRE-family HTH domain
VCVNTIVVIGGEDRRMARRPNALGALLRARRRATKTGFKQLSAATSVEQETLRKWETGETYEVPLRGVLIYARIVGISLAELEEAALPSPAESEPAHRDREARVRDAAAALGDVSAARGEGERPKRSSRRRPPGA